MRDVAGSNPVSNPRKLAHLVEQSVYRRLVAGSIPVLSPRSPRPGYGHLVRDKAASEEAVSSGFFPVLRTAENVLFVTYSVKQVFVRSKGASANVILSNLSMSLRFPNPFLYRDSGTGKPNGISERC